MADSFIKFFEKKHMDLKRIEAILFDVDGVLTDGRIYYDESGNEWKAFHVRDGLIIKRMLDMGFRFGAITGRSSRLVERRMKELGVEFLVQKCMNKKSALMKFAADYDVAFDHIAYVGDDLIDLPAMALAGVAACPADSDEEVKKRSDLVLEQRGGEGVVRELGERILKDRGRWDEFMNQFDRAVEKTEE